MWEKRRICIILMLGLSVLLFFILLGSNGSYGDDFSSYIVSDEEFEAIMKARSESGFPLVSDIIFGEESLFFDVEDGTFYYSIIEGDRGAFNPVVQMDSAEKETSIAIRKEQITNEMISGNKAIDFIVYTDDFYNIYKLKCTTLPLMNIEYEDEITEENTVISMQLFDNREEAAQREVCSDGTIHIRGGSTKSYPKLGYKVSLTVNSANGSTKKNKCALLGMRQDDDWILYAAYNDQEKIRNVFSSNLWMETCGGDNSFNIENGMKYEYIELFLNGRYWGLYALGYPIDDLQLGTKENKQECIYKKLLWNSEYPIEYAEDGTIAGYKIASSERSDWSILYDFYDKLNREDTDEDWYYSSIDLDNAIDYVLFINLIQGIDNVYNDTTKNMYITAKIWKDGEYKFLYTPWDMDITWGNAWAQDAWNLTVPYALTPASNKVMESGSLYKLLINHNENAWTAYLNKYDELRNKLWSDEAIMNMLDEYESQIFASGAYRRDMDRWPDGSYEDPKLELSVFRQYVLDRLHELDAYYERVAGVKDENVYIIRAAQYKNFADSNFVIQISRDDEDIWELLEYIGIQVSEIPDNCKFIFFNAKSGKAEFRDNLGVPGDIFETCIGTVELKVDNNIEYESENQCSVYIEGKTLMMYNLTEDNTMRVLFQEKEDAGFQSMWLGK
ncbi:MAG: CotH kinase family protein [Bacillota bacterium]|nr:CotH kinase family protein [Bacillota bacterium]